MRASSSGSSYLSAWQLADECMKISLREMAPLVTAQGSPQEMPLEVREPSPGQPKFPLPS